MQIYRILSALLSYPQADLIAAIPEIKEVLAADPDLLEPLQALLNYLTSNSLIAVQENYVGTFDRTHSLSLHLFEHIHGESRDRGQAMVDLIEEYRRHGFEPARNLILRMQSKAQNGAISSNTSVLRVFATQICARKLDLSTP